MSALTDLIKELAGLFVEDGALALAILAVVAVAAITALLLPDLAVLTGAILVLGSVGVLLANVMTAR